MPPIKFWLKPTYGLGDVLRRISRWLPWRPSWISERNNFCNSESLWCLQSSDGSIWLTGFGGDVVWRISRWPPSWISEQNDFSNSEISMLLLCFPSTFGSIWLTVWQISFKEFQDGRHSHLGYQNGTIFAILNLCVTVMPPIKFWLNLTYGLEGDFVWRISRWLPLDWNGTILANLNVHVATMSPTKFQLNPTYGSGGDVENVKS